MHRLLLTLEAFLSVGVIFPQTLDTGILGIVSDPSGAVIPGAAVTVTQTATGVAKTVASESTGRYELRYLVPGEYVVEAKAAGFRTERQSGISARRTRSSRISCMRPLTAVESGFPVIGIDGFLGMGDDQASSNLDNSRTYQWVDNLSIIRGRRCAAATASSPLRRTSTTSTSCN